VNRETGLLDTNVVAALPTTDLAGLLPSYTFITTITLAELAAGPFATDDPVERDRRLAVFEGVASTYPSALPFDLSAALAYTDIYVAVRKIGRKPRGRQADLGIAAIALSRRLPLFTANPDDFRGLDGLLDVVPVPARPHLRR
jgi:predicted nucleic acid-binding protein